MSQLPQTFHAKTRPSDCLVWVGATNNKGYGLVVVDGKVELARRVAYEAEYGPIPEGHVIDHVCRVRNCVRPSHLEAVTQGENNRRGRAAAALTPGDTCTNGHRIASEADLYRRPSGAVECRACRLVGDSRKNGRRRPTRQRRADRVAADLDLISANTT